MLFMLACFLIVRACELADLICVSKKTCSTNADQQFFQFLKFYRTLFMLVGNFSSQWPDRLAPAERNQQRGILLMVDKPSMLVLICACVIWFNCIC